MYIITIIYCNLWYNILDIPPTSNSQLLFVCLFFSDSVLCGSGCEPSFWQQRVSLYTQCRQPVTCYQPRWSQTRWDLTFHWWEIFLMNSFYAYLHLHKLLLSFTQVPMLLPLTLSWTSCCMCPMPTTLLSSSETTAKRRFPRTPFTALVGEASWYSPHEFKGSWNAFSYIYVSWCFCIKMVQIFLSFSQTLYFWGACETCVLMLVIASAVIELNRVRLKWTSTTTTIPGRQQHHSCD